MRGVPLRIERHSVVFELYNPKVMPQVSESLVKFEIKLQNLAIYSGHAVVLNLMDVGTKIVCEATLAEAAWCRTPLARDTIEDNTLAQKFSQFVAEWQKSFLILPEYQLIITNLLTFLSDLRLWLDQIESGLGSGAEDRRLLEARAVDQLRSPVIASLNNMFENFEVLCSRIPKELQAAHRAFGQRLLHPYLLCAPFINRCYTKPLGFAGDYEMMNMIVRNKLEGDSLYAKLANQYLLDQIGPMAVRGRVDFLNSRIVEETARVARNGKVAKIFCVACGPAWEAVNFISKNPLADRTSFRFLDFNEETLNYTTNKINEVRRQNQRQTQVQFVRNSVQNLLRAKGGPVQEFDLIYCSGLYDYLSDSVCTALNSHLYEMLKPGGALVVGNFAPNLPVRNFIEHFLEWFLIYRSAEEMLALAPPQAGRENCAVRAEPTGTNFFLEVRKPE